MSNLMHTAMLVRGMGGLQARGLGNWFDEWGDKIIGQGFDFGKTFLQSHYAAEAAKYQSPTYAPNYNTTAAAQAAALAAANQNADEYGSGGVSGAGIRIGGTLITWPVIGLAGLGLFLLQSPGYSRRGR